MRAHESLEPSRLGPDPHSREAWGVNKTSRSEVIGDWGGRHTAPRGHMASPCRKRRAETSGSDALVTWGGHDRANSISSLGRRITVNKPRTTQDREKLARSSQGHCPFAVPQVPHAGCLWPQRIRHARKPATSHSLSNLAVWPRPDTFLQVEDGMAPRRSLFVRRVRSARVPVASRAFRGPSSFSLYLSLSLCPSFADPLSRSLGHQRTLAFYDRETLTVHPPTVEYSAPPVASAVRRTSIGSFSSLTSFYFYLSSLVFCLCPCFCLSFSLQDGSGI